MLLEILIQIPSPENHVYKDFMDEARRLYKGNPTHLSVIHDFEQNYCSNEAIRWYTRDSFLFKMVNKVLRTRNTIIICKFRFFTRVSDSTISVANQCSAVYRHQYP